MAEGRRKQLIVIQTTRYNYLLVVVQISPGDRGLLVAFRAISDMADKLNLPSSIVVSHVLCVQQSYCFSILLQCIRRLNTDCIDVKHINLLLLS